MQAAKSTKSGFPSLQQSKMAEGTVIFLLNNLKIWLEDERMLFAGLRHEVLIISDELQQMRSFLGVAEAREETDPQLKEWARQMREIAYEIEDVLESYMLRHGGRIGGSLKTIYASIKSLKVKRELASQIKALRYRAQSASKIFREMYAVLPVSGSTAVARDTWYDHRADALLLEDTDVVGIERPKKQLLEWISTADYTLKVVSLVGMGGLGKTALAKRVYDDPSVKENIDHHAWITVSQRYELENLLIGLIKQLLKGVKQVLPPGFETMHVDEMREFIHSFLQNKRYIIVLDDVWNTNVWDSFKYAFPVSTIHGWGCIIITTRSKDIGDIACSSGGHVYELQRLQPQEAEELFKRKAFLGGSCPDHLKDISKNILKRCEGLPLAIVVIGSALSTKRCEIEEWIKFSHDLESNEEGHMYVKMSKVLSLSYYDLPYYLKACLLYLSIFPEDALLEKTTVIRLWIAEGFVEAKPGKTMEEIAEEYLNELSSRSLIQVASTSLDGKPRDFHIHNIVREYIISKARDQNIVAIDSQRNIKQDNRIRRLALDDRSIDYVEKIYNLKYLRTLLCFGYLGWGSSVGKVLHDGCRMLKVLDLRGAPLDAIPDEVYKLYHLKYLCLRNTNVSLIPKVIVNLAKLEILDLKGSRVIELPVEILKLRRLRYLLVYRYKVGYFFLPFDNIQSFEAPYEISQLVCLQKLCYINASANIVREIGKLKKLRRLGVTKLRREDGKELCSSLTELTYLSSLAISSVEEDEVIDLQYYMDPSCLQFLHSLVLTGRLEGLPCWIPSLKALTCLRLRLSRIRIGENPLEHLQALPNLQILDMVCAYEGEVLSFKSSGFQRLRHLYLYEMRELRLVRMEKGSLPLLRMLEMGDCKAMMELPMGMEHLTNLEYVKFIDMAEEFVEKFFEEKGREGHQWKLNHVPTIHIT